MAHLNALGCVSALLQRHQAQLAHEAPDVQTHELASAVGLEAHCPVCVRDANNGCKAAETSPREPALAHGTRVSNGGGSSSRWL